MTTPENRDPKDDVLLGDVFRPLVIYRRLIWQGAVAITVVFALMAGLYLAFQRTIRSASIQFRPTFLNSDDFKYPNGAPFAPTDITSPSIVEQVFVKNDLGQYCKVDDFRGGLVVGESSPELQNLALQYQARLVDTTLTAVERLRVETEYRDRRAALARGYELTYLQPRACSLIPEPVVFKVLAEVLETWAIESEQKRGVMKLNVALLTPGIFGRSGDADEPLLVRADMLRTAIGRVIENIRQVQALSGAELVRVGE